MYGSLGNLRHLHPRQVFTGRYSRGFFDLVFGAMLWSLLVMAYAILLTTDEYPPFTLSMFRSRLRSIFDFDDDGA